MSQLMSQLSLRQQLAQRIIIRISAEDYFSGEDRRRVYRRLVRDEGIGGVCVFQSNAVETATMLKELQQIASASVLQIPLLVCADFEYGVAMRLVGGTAFPHARNLGEGAVPATTFRVAQAIAKEAAMLGVQCNFAPVCDVNNNFTNPVIGNRAFGESAEIVAAHASEYIRGTQSVGVMACAKHFPGHGDTSMDSHDALPVLRFDRERLEQLELLPFRAAVQAGVRAVMVGHLAVPALEQTSDVLIPASLSRRIITGLLREELGFEGLIITDALDMKAVTNRASVHDVDAAMQAVVEAFTAGADIALMPSEPVAALDTAVRAAKDGLLQNEDIAASVQRILEAKAWCGLVENERYAAFAQERRFAATMTEESVKQHQLLALETAKRGLKWFAGSGSISDVQPMSQFQQIAGFALVDDDNAQIGAATSFFRYLAQSFQGNCDFGFVDAEMEEPDLTSFVAGTHDAEAFVIAVFARARSSEKGVEIAKRFHVLTARLVRDKPVIVILFGNPYIRQTFPIQPATAYLCAFSSSEPAIGAAAFELAQEP
jgi:beta-glucosidase-like glycosyl hydrolase